MKRILLLLTAACCMTAASAQSWTDALKKGASSLADKASGGKLTAAALCTDWQYARPGVRLDSSDAAAAASGTMLEGTVQEKLAPLFEKAGIRPGSCTFAFDKEGNFTAVIGSQTHKGTYVYDPETHAIVLSPEKGRLGIGGGEWSGYAYLSGTAMQLLFPADKLVGLAESLGSKIPSLQSTAALLGKFDKVYLGFEFAH